jgi:Skp family chaperone for outer membrane proteins
MKQQLETDAPHLTRDVGVARERQLYDRVKTEQNQLREKNRIIQEAAQVALGQIERTLIGIIRQVAEARGMNLVLHRSQVALNVQEYDITEAVTEQLNRALPTVQIPPDNVDPATLPKDWGSVTPVAAH